MHTDRHDPTDPPVRQAAPANHAPEIGSGASATDSGKVSYMERERALAEKERQTAGKAATTGGTAGGAIAGATAGSVVAFPIGTAIGAIAGAVGGWWAAHGSGGEELYTDADDERYRRHWEASPGRPADRDFAGARPAYQLGHIARHNPDYRGRSFESIEADLRHGWTADDRARYGEWDAARPFAQAAYTLEPLNPDVAVTPGTWSRSLDGQPAGRIDPNVGITQGGSTSHQRATYNDPARGYPDPVVGSSGAAAGAPNEMADSSAPGWMATPSDQGGFGTRPGAGAPEPMAREERGTEDSDAARRRARGEPA